jgi:hypothetical protein
MASNSEVAQIPAPFLVQDGNARVNVFDNGPEQVYNLGDKGKYTFRPHRDVAVDPETAEVCDTEYVETLGFSKKTSFGESRGNGLSVYRSFVKYVVKSGKKSKKEIKKVMGIINNGGIKLTHKDEKDILKEWQIGVDTGTAMAPVNADVRKEMLARRKRS